jgi:hypothetical protein
LLEHCAQFSVEGFEPDLQERMHATFALLHLLALAKPFADDLVDRGLHKTRSNGLLIAPPLPIMPDETIVVLDVDAKLFHCFGQLLKFRIARFEVIDQRLKVVEISEISVGQHPFRQDPEALAGMKFR